MKKNISTLILVIILTTLQLAAQVSIFSKKEDLKDINRKTLMVVNENNSFTDLALKDAVEKNWDISKYEFINQDKFEQIKGDSSYYFLTRVKGIFKKEREPGVEFIALYKGGPSYVEAISEMSEVLSLPFQSLNDGSDNSHFLNMYVNAIQNHVLRVQRKKIAAHLGITWYSNRMSEIRNGRMLICETDISEGLNSEMVEEWFDNNGVVVPEEDIEVALDNNSKNTFVTLSIAPQIPQKGSYCYKLVIGTESNEIYYYRKQKISPSSPKGFLEEDFKKISIPFNLKK